MKNQCIIFVLKDHEKWLTNNIEKIVKLSYEFDIYFVTRIFNDRINQIIKSNNFVNIPLSYDSGYYDALCSGFEFIQNLKYRIWVEFGEFDRINLDEVEKLNSINKDYDYEKSIIFCSKYIKKHRPKRYKKYIYFSIGKKIYDPYSRFKIYNDSSFDAIKHLFQYKMDPQNFLNLLYKKPNFIEVRIKSKKVKLNHELFWKKVRNKFKLYIYAIFILPYIKRNGLNKY
ncbi:MAG: hypothetical protein HDR43_01475 [Mycoplasma sp.]|nr:hypothetical protein [Mycoplasma sp.]